jgi:NAD(P)-dependent dehydrogenase (short-subunit alcohol dehydrogenase family)
MADSELFGLDGAVALVTGASGWLGPSIVECLARAGADVVAVGRDRARLERALSPLRAARVAVEIRTCDITTDGWPELVRAVSNDRGRLDVLVNNAHIGRGGSLRTATHEQFVEAHKLAVVATWAGVEAARGGLVASHAQGGSPAVINVASMYGMVVPDFAIYEDEHSWSPPFYGVAKAGLLHLTRYAAAELGPLGIRVNSITPGPFPAPAAQRNVKLVGALVSKTALKRIGRPADVRTAVLFLASPHSSFVTGANIVIDGGWTIT